MKERARLQALQRRFRVYDLEYSSTTVERSQEHASLYKILYNILGRQATRALFSNLTAVTSTKIVGISHSKHTGMTSKGRLCHHPKPPRRNHPTETVAVSNSTHLSSLSDFFFLFALISNPLVDCLCYTRRPRLTCMQRRQRGCCCLNVWAVSS